MTVKVQKGKVKTKKLALEGKTTLEMKARQTLQLKWIVTPVTSQDKLTFKTSNKKVATVSKKGVVKAVGKGTAKITIASGKKKKTVKITVK